MSADESLRLTACLVRAALRVLLSFLLAPDCLCFLSKCFGKYRRDLGAYRAVVALRASLQCLIQGIIFGREAPKRGS